MYQKLCDGNVDLKPQKETLFNFYFEDITMMRCSIFLTLPCGSSAPILFDFFVFKWYSM